jgi:exosortase/archaeosortase family protein
MSEQSAASPAQPFWKKYDSDLTRFILKTTAFFIVWYILYDMIVGPDGRIDHWLSVNVVEASAAVINLFEAPFVHGRVVGLPGQPGILLVDGCNGIAAMGLFFGFLLGYPGKVLPKLVYGFIGVLLLYLVNVIRIVALTFTQKYYPDIFAFTHDYSTTFLFYLVIFVLWVVWSEIQHKLQ